MNKLAPLLLLLACDDPTMVVVDNAYADGVTRVDKVWWSETLIPDVVSPGAESPAYRTVPANDYAYALIDRGAGPIPVRTATAIAIDHGATLHIQISQTTVEGDCASGTLLSQPVASFITQSIFPGEFAGVTYDPATCTSSPSLDAGSSD
jgi:hypothetical protein